ncbi:MAG TPA: 7-cyano-7-deazaguanine synthase, partial [Pirellulales bacterium]
MPPTKNSSIGVLASGGLDSAILVAHLRDQGRQVQPLYVNSGLYWQNAERAGLKAFLAAIVGKNLAELVEFDLPLADLYQGHWSLSGKAVPGTATADDAVYLPGRNLLLAIKPALWCQMHSIGQLALGVLGSNPFDDASDAFFKSLEEVLARLGQPPIEIVRPFGKLHKNEVMQLGREYPLGLSFSCIDPVDNLHCGH